MEEVDMYDFCYRLYFRLRKQLKRINNEKSLRFRATLRIIGYLEAYFNLKWTADLKTKPVKTGINQQPREERIVASLTTYPARIDTVWIAIETIMRQSIKADQIILWLAEEQFSGIDSLPKDLLDLQSRGLTIRFCDDLRSHKKYFYTMQEYKKDLVILFDDDLYYPSDTIEKLLDMHKKYPEDICCITSQHVGTNWNTKPSTWRNPFLFEENEHSSEIQAYTGAGSLFPPDSLPEDAFDREIIQRLCFTADDLWLAFMAHRNGTKVTSLNDWRPFPVGIYGTAKNSLWHVNAEEGLNDVQWQKLNEYYTEKE